MLRTETGSPGADARLAAAGLGVSLLAVSWAAVLIVLTRSSPAAVAFGRLALAALLLSPALLAGTVRRELRRARGRSVPALFAGALLGVHLLLWIASLRLTSVASSMFLLSGQAVMGLLASHILLGERVAWRGWIAVGTAALGSVVIAGGDVHFGWGFGGDLLSLLSAAAFVGYLSVGRAARRRMSLVPWLLLLYSSAALWLLPVLAVPFPHRASVPWRRETLLLLALAAGPTILGHGLMNYALRYIRVHQVQLVVLAEPFLAVLWARLTLGADVPPWTWPGGVLVVVGCALAVSEERKARRVLDR